MKLDAVDKTRIVIGITCVINYLHKEKVIHGDLKSKGLVSSPLASSSLESPAESP